MMHAVEPPEGRHGMEQHVLKVDGKIQGGDGQWDAGPCRQIERMQQSPPSALGDQSKTDRGRREDETDQNRIQHDDADVAGPARTTPELLISARREHFPNRHRREDAGKRNQAYQGLVGEKDARHCVPPGSAEVRYEWPDISRRCRYSSRSSSPWA